MAPEDTIPAPHRRPNRLRRSRSHTLWLFLLLPVLGGTWFFMRYYLMPKSEPALRDTRTVVCIDPGHPSETNSGRLMQHDTSELAMNWAVALKLESLLSEDPNIKVVKTRDNMDKFTRNRVRALTANREHATIAIHLHCDAGPSHGFTVYYPDREGTAEGKTGPPSEVREESEKAANAIHSGMLSVLQGTLRDRGIKGESFTRVGRSNGALTTSIFSEVPTVTVEMVFLSNHSDAEFIKSEEGQQVMAAALATGIKDYLSEANTIPAE